MVKDRIVPPNLLASFPGAAHDKGDVLNLAEGGHGAVPGQAQQQVRCRIVLRDLPHHALRARAARARLRVA